MAGEAALVLAQRHLNATLACLADVSAGERDAGRHGSETQLDVSLAAFKARSALAAVEQAIARGTGLRNGEQTQ